MRRSKQRCLLCGAATVNVRFCEPCQARRQDAADRLMAGAVLPGDAALLNTASGRKRVAEDGRVLCIGCNQHLPVTGFYAANSRGSLVPLLSYCTACQSENSKKRRVAEPAPNVVHLPRAKPPATDSGRQLRTLLDDLGRTLSRLDALAARSAPDQFGDEIERRTLASQLSRLATSAIDLTGRLSGIVTTEESDHDRRARVRSIR